MKHYFKAIIPMIFLFAMSCKRDVDKYAVGGTVGPKISDIISFKSVSSISVPSDSSTVSIITVQINQQTDSVYRSVTFHTTNGLFLNGLNTDTIVADAYGIATITVLGSIAAPAIISAAVSSYVVDTTIQFTPALPADMLLTADNYVIDSTQTIQVSAQLIRSHGRVSNGQLVHFTTSRANKTDSLIIPDFVTSQNGIASATLQNPFLSHGSFIVTAWTISLDNDTLRKSINILIK